MARRRKTETDPSAALFREFAFALGKAAPDEDKLVESAVEACIKLLQAKQCSVWLYDEAQNCLRMKAAIGYKHFEKLKQDEVDRMVYLLSKPGELGTTGWIFEKQQPVVADSYEQLRKNPGYQGRHDPQLHNIEESDRSNISAGEHPCQQFYGAPITLGDEQFGVLKVENKRRPDDTGIKRFSDEDQAALDTVAAMLGLALRYARASKNAQERLISYYRFTVHAIRNEIFPIEGTRTVLKNFPHEGLTEDQSSRIDLASNLCQLGTEGVHFYLSNLLKFLEERLVFGPVDIKGVLRDEASLLKRPGLGLNLEIQENFCPEDAPVSGDRVFLSAVVKELIRNARHAIQRRNDKEQIEGKEQTSGLITVSVHHHSDDTVRNVRIRISDNGSATVNDRDKAQLLRFFEKSRYSGDASVKDAHGRLGLLFINEVISKHGGTVELDVKDGQTTFEMLMPATS